MDSENKNHSISLDLHLEFRWACLEQLCFFGNNLLFWKVSLKLGGGGVGEVALAPFGRAYTGQATGAYEAKWRPNKTKPIRHALDLNHLGVRWSNTHPPSFPTQRYSNLNLTPAQSFSPDP